MSYSVKVLTASMDRIPFEEMQQEVESIKLISGTGAGWDKIEIYDPAGALISVLSRLSLADDRMMENEQRQLKDSISNRFPQSAREWLADYFSRVQTIYTFQLFPDQINKKGWPVLGKVQNLLRYRLSGVIQADQEGCYNENGDYILWDMYENAAGTIPAAVLDDKGTWISFQLRLNDHKAVEEFKEGKVPRRGLLDQIFRR